MEERKMRPSRTFYVLRLSNILFIAEGLSRQAAIRFTERIREMRKGVTLLEVLVVLALIGILVLLLLPAVQKARESAALVQSQNNLKQIALGLHQVAGEYDGNLPGVFQSAPVFEDATFITLLLYLEQSQVFNERLGQNRVQDFLRFQVRTYINPLDGSSGVPNDEISLSYGDVNQTQAGISSYALNAQFFLSYPRMNRITDGLSNTIWLAEHYGWNCNQTTFLYDVIYANRWIPFQSSTFAQGGPGLILDRGDYYPITTGVPPQSTAEDGKTFQVRPSVSECDPRLPNASSTWGLQVGMADGSVHILAPSISPHLFWDMVTPDRGEVLPPE
jgi:prepilin-type N-terminal cleavage/methylation domain-containing protein